MHFYPYFISTTRDNQDMNLWTHRSPFSNIALLRESKAIPYEKATLEFDLWENDLRTKESVTLRVVVMIPMKFPCINRDCSAPGKLLTESLAYNSRSEYGSRNSRCVNRRQAREEKQIFFEKQISSELFSTSWSIEPSSQYEWLVPCAFFYWFLEE